MKHLLFLLLFAASQSLYAQHNYDNTADEKKADELLDKVKARQATDDEKKQLQAIAVLIQNKGQDLEEKQHQSKKALTTIDKAIIVFTALEDTLSVANNRKYKGYLSGRLGKFREAIAETKTAIDLYGQKKMNAEIAVSQFDLARMFEFENKTDSAIYYADQSHAFWKTKSVDLRVLIINNMLVSLYLKASLPEKAKSVQEASALLVKKPDLHWQAIIDFYFTSMLLYKTINDIGVAGDYRQLYAAKIDALRKSGINARSYYEGDRE